MRWAATTARQRPAKSFSKGAGGDEVAGDGAQRREVPIGTAVGSSPAVLDGSTVDCVVAGVAAVRVAGTVAGFVAGSRRVERVARIV